MIKRSLFVILLMLVTVPRAAHAVQCDQVTTPSPLGTIIYAQVGDTQNNLMRRLSRALRDNTNNKITLVWTTSGSCTNINAIYNGVAIATTVNMSYAPSVADNATWDPANANDAPLTCTVPAGTIPDIANSALFNSACNPATPPASVFLNFGPVQAYVMAVPEASTQTAITFEEAYFVFGFGTNGQVAPWTDELSMYIRTITKSTLLAWAANISVPGDKWKGVRRDSSPEVVADLQGATANAEKAIGILGAEVYDGLRSTLNVLAFRAKGQYAAYYPDSTFTARDKKNVRDGHYTVWSPTVWMDKVDGNGDPVKPNTRYITDLIAGKTVTPVTNFSMIDIIAAVGLVPDCAMRVKRGFEGGPLSLYQPTESCVCKYESLVDTSSCATCDTTTSCATGTCRNGYCEVQ